MHEALSGGAERAPSGLDGSAVHDSAVEPVAGDRRAARTPDSRAAALVGELSGTAPRSRPQRPPWPEDLREKVIAGRDRPDGETHPEQLAAYLSKYLTKGTEEFGLDGPGRIYSADDAR
jgi:hypothetical protein